MNENELNNDLEILDRFDHPKLSDELTNRIVGSMSAAQATQKSHRHWFFTIGMPLAAAAVLVMAFSLFFPAATSKTVGTEIITVWSDVQETEAETLFADLDFSTIATSQPAASQKDAPTELDTFLIEVMTSS